MGVSHCDVIAVEGVGLHNGWCLETMDIVDFLLCCIQNTQNCVAKALVPVLNGPEFCGPWASAQSLLVATINIQVQCPYCL